MLLTSRPEPIPGEEIPNAVSCVKAQCTVVTAHLNRTLGGVLPACSALSGEDVGARRGIAPFLG
jgi:hypothetical protein